MRGAAGGRIERTLALSAVGDERGASTRCRVLAHRPALEAAGWHTELRLAPPLGGPRTVRAARRALRVGLELLFPGRTDVLLVHRRTFPVALAGRVRAAAARCVFDMDDAIDLPPPSRALDERELRRYRSRFEATTREFDLVLCGNADLAARLPHDRFEILPTPVDTVRFAPSRLGAPDGRTLGWVGHSDNLPYLESLAPAFRELARRHAGLRLVVVADRAPRLDGVPVEFRRWTLADEVSCFDGIGVGLMPLVDSPWARGKCAFKAIQFLALGVPAVASPVGMTPDVVRHGDTGFLASSEAEWVAWLDRLLADPDLARRLGEAGRRHVEKHYSLAVVSRRLVEILESLSGRPGAG